MFLYIICPQVNEYVLPDLWSEEVAIYTGGIKILMMICGDVRAETRL